SFDGGAAAGAEGASCAIAVAAQQKISSAVTNTAARAAAVFAQRGLADRRLLNGIKDGLRFMMSSNLTMSVPADRINSARLAYSIVALEGSAERVILEWFTRRTVNAQSLPRRENPLSRRCVLMRNCMRTLCERSRFTGSRTERLSSELGRIVEDRTETV